MSTTPVEARTADEFCEDCGYEPELKRSLSSFQMFAFSFASISVAVGIFGTYNVVLQQGGPIGIWLWIVAAVGQVLVALVYAQFAARIPLSGSSYQWASRLANPKIGWVFGWLAVWNVGLSVVAVNLALAQQVLMPFFYIPPNETTARLIALGLMVLQAVLAILSTRIVGWVNSTAVGLEIGIVVVLGIALVVVFIVTSHGSWSNLTSRGLTEHASNYYAFGGGLMGAMLVGVATLQGFDTAATMAEEAKEPFRSVPRAIVGSVAAASILGMLFLVALTASIGDVAKISADPSPVTAIMQDQLGPTTERILLLAIIFAFFGAGLVCVTATARFIFAMSRDQRFPAHRLWQKVNPRTQTPIPATILVITLGVALMFALPGNALQELLTTGAIFPFMLYGGTIVLYLAVRSKLDSKEGAFELGRFELPIAIIALIWVVAVLCVLVAISNLVVTVAVVGGVLVVGACYIAYLVHFKSDIIDTEPGNANLF